MGALALNNQQVRRSLLLVLIMVISYALPMTPSHDYRQNDLEEPVEPMMTGPSPAHDYAIQKFLEIEDADGVFNRAMSRGPGGEVHAVGEFWGTLKLGNIQLNAAGTSSPDSYVLQVNKDGGDIDWISRVSSTGTLMNGLGAVIQDVETDSAGDAIVTGYSYGNTSFINNNGTTEQNHYFDSAGDMFVGKLSGTNGDWLYVSKVSSSGTDFGTDIEIAPSGKILITGCIGGNAGVYSSNSMANTSFELDSEGGRDVMVGEISSTGVWSWVYAGGSSSNDWGLEIAALPNNKYILTGVISGNATFGNHSASHSDLEDVFIATVDSSGWQDATSIRGTGDVLAKSLIAHSSGKAALIVDFTSNLIFPSGGTISSSSTTSDRAVVVTISTTTLTRSWTKLMGSSTDLVLDDIELIPDGTLSVIGQFAGSLTLPNNDVLYSQNIMGFILTMDASNGAIKHHLQLGDQNSGGVFKPKHLIPDSNNSYLIGGFYKGSPKVDGNNLPDTGNAWHAFLMRIVHEEEACLVNGSTNGISDPMLCFGSNDGEVKLTGMVRDDTEYFHVTGMFNGSMFLGGKLHLAEDWDVFVAKFTRWGNVWWISTAGGPGDQSSNDIELGANGEVYIGGGFENTMSFKPGLNLTASAGTTGMYIARLHGNGSWDEAFSSEGEGSANATDLVVDESYDVYVAGNLEDTVKFSTYSSNTELTSRGGTDVFIAKLDVINNSWAWAISGGSTDDDTAEGLDYNSTWSTWSEDVVLVGRAKGDLQFSTHSYTHSGVANDLFVVTTDSSGSWQDLLGLGYGGGGNILATDVAVTDAGYVYIVGTYSGSNVNFSSQMLSATGFDGFVLTMSLAGGSSVWNVRTLTGDGAQGVNAISLDEFSNLYLAGYFENTITAGQESLTSSSGKDQFFATINSGFTDFAHLDSFGTDGDDIFSNINTMWDASPVTGGVFEGDMVTDHPTVSLECQVESCISLMPIDLQLPLQHVEITHDYDPDAKTLGVEFSYSRLQTGESYKFSENIHSQVEGYLYTETLSHTATSSTHSESVEVDVTNVSVGDEVCSWVNAKTGDGLTLGQSLSTCTTMIAGNSSGGNDVTWWNLDHHSYSDPSKFQHVIDMAFSDDGDPAICFAGEDSAIENRRFDGDNWWHSPDWDDSFTNVEDCGIAVDSVGKVHMAYTDGMGLKYLYQGQSNPSVTALETSSSGNVNNVRISLDSDDNVYIGYRYKDGGSDPIVRLTEYDDSTGEWTTSTVSDTSGGAGDELDMVVSRDGDVHFVYDDVTEGRLRYAVRNAYQTTWTSEYMDETNSNALDTPSIALDSTYSPHVVFMDDGTNSGLRYAYRDSGGWSYDLIYEYGCYRPSLQVDSNDGIWVACIEEEAATLDLYHGTDGDWNYFNVETDGDGTIAWEYHVLGLAGESEHPMIAFADGRGNGKIRALHTTDLPEDGGSSGGGSHEWVNLDHNFLITSESFGISLDMNGFQASTSYDFYSNLTWEETISVDIGQHSLLGVSYTSLPGNLMIMASEDLSDIPARSVPNSGQWNHYCIDTSVHLNATGELIGSGGYCDGFVASPSNDGDWGADTLETDWSASDETWDTDGDGFGDWMEWHFGGDPNDPGIVPTDADGDGLSLEFENAIGTSDNDNDWDDDGFDDLMEFKYNSNPDYYHSRPVDMDFDSCADYWEDDVALNSSDDDSDQDGILDCWDEDPWNATGTQTDTDGDGIPDDDEVALGSDPNEADSDGDYVPDGHEFAGHTDPNDSNSRAVDYFMDGQIDLAEMFGTASASSSGGGTSPSDILDGSDSIGWQPAEDCPGEWIEVDLGAVYRPAAIHFNIYNPSYGDDYPRDISIEMREDSSDAWTQVDYFSFADDSGIDGWFSAWPNLMKAQYVRLYCQSNADLDGWQHTFTFGEIKVFDSHRTDYVNFSAIDGDDGGGNSVFSEVVFASLTLNATGDGFTATYNVDYLEPRDYVLTWTLFRSYDVDCQNIAWGGVNSTVSITDAQAADDAGWVDLELDSGLITEFNGTFCLEVSLGLPPSGEGSDDAVWLDFSSSSVTISGNDTVLPNDSDGDGVDDADDLCPSTPSGTNVDTDGCPDSASGPTPTLEVEFNEREEESVWYQDIEILYHNPWLNQSHSLSVRVMDSNDNTIYSYFSPMAEDHQNGWWMLSTDMIYDEAAQTASKSYKIDLNNDAMMNTGAWEGKSRFFEGVEYPWLQEGEYCVEVSMGRQSNESEQPMDVIKNIFDKERVCDTFEHSAMEGVTWDGTEEPPQTAMDKLLSNNIVSSILSFMDSTTGQIVSIGLAVLGFAGRMVLARGARAKNKRVTKFMKAIRKADSRGRLKIIEMDVEKANEKNRLPRGGYGDLMEAIEGRLEKLGFDENPSEGGTSGDWSSAADDFADDFSRASDMMWEAQDMMESAKEEAAMTRQAIEEMKDRMGIGQESDSAYSSGPRYERTGVRLSDSAKSSGPALPGQRDEPIDASTTNLVSDILSKNIAPKDPCHCGSGKMYKECHMKRESGKRGKKGKRW